MSKNVSALITNNLIAIAIHICLCFVLFYPLLFIHTRLDGIFLWLAMGLYTIASFGSYFLVGGFFLRSTKNARTDIFSVIALSVVLLITVFLVYGFHWFGLIFGSMVLYILVIIASLFQISFEGAVCILMALSPLPSLAMWTGMRAKKYADTFIPQSQQPTLRNRLLLIIHEKKESFTLFIALICSVYLSLGIILAIKFIVDGIGMLQFYWELLSY